MTTTNPPACTVKGCKADINHHHIIESGEVVQCIESACPFVDGDREWTAKFAPRQTRKQLQAEIDRLTAENADLHAEIADKTDRLARLETKPPVVEVYDTHGAVLVSIAGEPCTGMVFEYKWADEFHACAAQFGINTFHPTQAEAVAAIVAAWKAAR